MHPTINLRNVTGVFFHNGTRTLDLIASTWIYINKLIDSLEHYWEHWVWLWIKVHRNTFFIFFIFRLWHFVYSLYTLATLCSVFPGHFVPKLNTPHLILYVHVFLLCIFRPPQSSVYSHHSLSFSSRTSPGNSCMLSFHQPPNENPFSR